MDKGHLDEGDQKTNRQKILQVLQEADDPLTVRRLSQEIGLSEKDVLLHLEHINKSLQKQRSKIEVVAAKCKSCGFHFQKRKDYKKPSKCPLCRSEYIDPPSFFIQSK